MTISESKADLTEESAVEPKMENVDLNTNGTAVSEAPTAPQKTFKEMTMSERLKYTREIITVEPLMAAYVMSAVLCLPAIQHLSYSKACLSNLAYDDDVCKSITDNLLYHSEEESKYPNETAAITIVISNNQSWTYPLQSVMPLILVLFLGAYSDRYKIRKPFLLIPLIGELLSVAGCILCVIFMKQTSLEALLGVQIVLPSFFGGQTMLTMAVFAYIADVSTLEMRTLRVGVVQIVLNLVYPLVQSFSGVLFREIGYIGIFLIAGCFYLFALFYGYFLIKEPRKPETALTKKNFCSEVFDTSYATDTFALLLMKRKGNDRKAMFLLLLTFFVNTFVNTGEGNTFILYVFYIFSWTVVDISFFSTTNTLIHLVGTILGVPLFTRIFKLGDAQILLLTLVDKIIANIMYGLSNTTTMLYISTAVSLFTGVTNVALRSMATKVVSEDDLGKAQSLYAVCEAIGPAVALPIYNKAIFNNTLESFPAAFLFFGAIVYIVLCILILVFLVLKRVKRKSEAEMVDLGHEKAVSMEEVYTTHM